MYPSHSSVIKVMKENEKDIIAKIKVIPVKSKYKIDIICSWYRAFGEQDDSKQLFMPSAQDHKNVRLGGIDEAVLRSRLAIVEFPDMKHGWIIWGDISKEEIKNDVGKAIKYAVEHFETNIPLIEEKMETKFTQKLHKMHI